MKYLLRPALLALMLSLSACGWLAGASGHIKKAEQAMGQGDYNRAVIELRSVVEKDPANKAAQLLLVRAHLQRGDLEAAQRALDAAAKAGATPVELAESRAKWLAYQGKLDQLLADIDAGKSDLAEPLRSLYRAHALLGLGRIAEAQLGYETLLAKDPALIDARLRSADAHAMLGRTQLALQQVDLALQTDPKSAEGWATRGGLLDALDRVDEAREARQKAIGFAPGQLSFTQYLALLSNSFMTALQGGDLQTARNVYKTMQNMTPGSPLVRLYAAEIALAAGDVSVASADLTTLAGEVPDFQQVHAALITALLDKESFELALRQVDELVKASGDNRGAAAARGPIRAAAAAAQGSVERAVAIASAQVLMGEPHIATRTIDTALVKYPDSADLAAGRIALDLQARRKSDALKRALALAESQPDKALALGMLAQAQVSSREYAKAVDVYEQLWKVAPTADLAVALSRAKRDAKMADSPEPMRRWLQTKPEDYAVRLLLADAEATAGNTDNAQAEYERILRAKPNTVIALNNLAIIYGQRNDPRALPMAKKAYSLTPKAPVVADTYGWLLAQSGAVQQALPLLQAAVKDSPALPEMRYHLADVMARTGDREGARSMVLEALRGDTEFFGRDAAIKLRDSLNKP